MSSSTPIARNAVASHLLPISPSPATKSQSSNQSCVLSAESLDSARFTVKPSSLLKSPVVRRTRKLSSGGYQDRLMHLSAANYRHHRQRTLYASQKLRADAEDKYLQNQQRELFILMHAAERNLHWSALDGQLALALAKAAKGTLQAEEEAIRRRLQEAENLAATLRDALDEARGRTLDAEFQVGSILSTFERNGIFVDTSCDAFTPPPLRVLDTLASCDTVGSLSEINSPVGDDDETRSNF